MAEGVESVKDFFFEVDKYAQRECPDRLPEIMSLWQGLVDAKVGVDVFCGRLTSAVGRPMEADLVSVLGRSIGAVREALVKKELSLGAVRAPAASALRVAGSKHKRPAEPKELTPEQAALMIAKDEGADPVKSELEDDGYEPAAKRTPKTAVWKCTCLKSFCGYTGLKTHVHSCLKLTLPEVPLITDKVDEAMKNRKTTPAELIRLWALEHGLPSAAPPPAAYAAPYGRAPTWAVPGTPGARFGFPLSQSTPMHAAGPAQSPQTPVRPASPSPSMLGGWGLRGSAGASPVGGLDETVLLLRSLKKEMGDLRLRMESMEASMMLKLNSLERRIEEATSHQ